MATGRIVFVPSRVSPASMPEAQEGATDGVAVDATTAGDGDVSRPAPAATPFQGFDERMATDDIKKRIEEEVERRRARATKFNIDYKPPSAKEIVENDETLWAQYVQEFGKLKHSNPALQNEMPAVEESDEVVEKRRARFGVVSAPEAIPTGSDDATGPMDIKSRVQRAKRFGINVTEKLAKTNEEQAMVARRVVGDDEAFRYNSVHMHGTDNMHTKDIFHYFYQTKPTHLEWINDSSLNVCWDTADEAKEALAQMSSEYATDVANVEDWRPGKPFKDTNMSIWLRAATTKDVKVRDAWKKSVYYAKQQERRNKHKQMKSLTNGMVPKLQSQEGRRVALSARLTSIPVADLQTGDGAAEEAASDSNTGYFKRSRDRRGESDEDDEDDGDDDILVERAKRSKLSNGSSLVTTNGDDEVKDSGPTMSAAVVDGTVSNDLEQVVADGDADVDTEEVELELLPAIGSGDEFDDNDGDDEHLDALSKELDG